MLWGSSDGLSDPDLTLMPGISVGNCPFPLDFPVLLSIGFVVGSDAFLDFLSFSCYVCIFISDFVNLHTFSLLYS